ncbi:hypothetical protein [Rhizobium sp. 2TAF27]|uniref:hypothetical protein n=1 Tax=Rhizobium sp. 2TAF27 TaxID=3233013 RepID=UPI003F97E88A
MIAFAQRVADGKKNWKEWTVPVGCDAILQAEEVLRRNGGEDIYISQQTFSRWRGIADLTAIGSSYVDLDYHNRERWRGKLPRDVASAVIYTLEERRLPLPSYILSTGRGLVCVWLLELLPFAVLPRWNAVQKALAEALTDFGADKRALDAARVFRLAGSVNSKADQDRRHVGMIWCQGSPETPTRHEFGTLADEVLPFTQAELVSLRATRATRKATGLDRDIKPARHLTQATWWGTVFEDLQRLRLHRNPETGTLPPGKRDAWIFLAANALSWMNVPDVMSSQIRILAMQATDWNEAELGARLGTVVKRARRAASGLTMEFSGRDIDPRYRFCASTIVEWLGIDPAEQRAAGLRALVDKDRRKELNTERTRQSRHRRGAADRNAQQAERLELGKAALELAATQNMSRAALSAQFGVSAGQISKAMAEARQLSK